MWKLVLVSIGAARALPSSLSSGDSLEPTLRALDDLDEDVQPVGDLLAVKRLGDGDEISVGGVGRKVGASPCRSSPRALRARLAHARHCGSPIHPTVTTADEDARARQELRGGARRAGPQSRRRPRGAPPPAPPASPSPPTRARRRSRRPPALGSASPPRRHASTPRSAPSRRSCLTGRPPPPLPPSPPPPPSRRAGRRVELPRPGLEPEQGTSVAVAGVHRRYAKCSCGRREDVRGVARARPCGRRRVLELRRADGARRVSREVLLLRRRHDHNDDGAAEPAAGAVAAAVAITTAVAVLLLDSRTDPPMQSTCAAACGWRKQN